MMLYSELKERENRFIISLKISFPFLILALFLFYIFKVSPNDIVGSVLFVILIPIYIYYIFYLIYSSFKTTLIDPITKTFNRKEIYEKIEKIKKKRNDFTVILIKIDNIADISGRYGITNIDNILKVFIKKLDTFFKNHKFKDVSIGRYDDGHFLLILKGREKELKHLIMIFEKKLKNVGINNIELKIDFSLLSLNYDKNIKNIIKKLFLLIKDNKDILDIKPNELEKIICDAIDRENFVFKYQPLIHKDKKNMILEILPKIYTKNRSVISRVQIQRAVNHLGRETQFDKKIISTLLKELENFDFEDKLISIKLSAVTIRNIEFRHFLNEIFSKSPLKPENFILEFSERRAYKEICRFREILNQYKQSGFKIGIDNFGGNNCSLEYIKTLPIDIVKFDIEYTKNISNERYQHITEAYIKLLNSLHVDTVIKFVDKEDTYKIIEEFGFDYIQGFLVSKLKNLKEI